MKLGWIPKSLAVATIILLIGTGCTGINSTQSVSPLSFFLPGLVQTKPVRPQAVPQAPIEVVDLTVVD